jgi:hypothetical protein
MRLQIDLQLYDYLKRFLSRIDLSGEQYSAVAMSLMLLCEREAHFEETKEKLRDLLTKGNTVLMPSYLGDMTFRMTPHVTKCKEKMNEITLLEQMINLMQ